MTIENTINKLLTKTKIRSHHHADEYHNWLIEVAEDYKIDFIPTYFEHTKLAAKKACINDFRAMLINTLSEKSLEPPEDIQQETVIVKGPTPPSVIDQIIALNAKPRSHADADNTIYNIHKLYENLGLVAIAHITSRSSLSSKKAFIKESQTHLFFKVQPLKTEAKQPMSSVIDQINATQPLDDDDRIEMVQVKPAVNNHPNVLIMDDVPDAETNTPPVDEPKVITYDDLPEIVPDDKQCVNIASSETINFYTFTNVNDSLKESVDELNKLDDALKSLLSIRENLITRLKNEVEDKQPALKTVVIAEPARAKKPVEAPKLSIIAEPARAKKPVESPITPSQPKAIPKQASKPATQSASVQADKKPLSLDVFIGQVITDAFIKDVMLITDDDQLNNLFMSHGIKSSNKQRAFKRFVKESGILSTKDANTIRENLIKNNPLIKFAHDHDLQNASVDDMKATISQYIERSAAVSNCVRCLAAMQQSTYRDLFFNK
jgi:hypothetical protein